MSSSAATGRRNEPAADNGQRPRVERWVEVGVQEAHNHCGKHLPHLVEVAGGEESWGTDDARAKGGDYFGASCEPRPWVVADPRTLGAPDPQSRAP